MKTGFGQADFGSEAALHMEQHEKSVRGGIRYEVVKANLLLFLPDPALKVIDIGGGSGRDAAWLASLGHDVTLVDPGKEQVQAAEERKTELPKNVRDNLKIIRGEIDTAVESGERYDLVLSHCVNMYQEDHRSYVQKIGRLCAAGGLASHLEKNHKARRAELGPGSGLRYNNFMSSGSIDKNRAGKKAYAFKRAELQELIEEAGFDILGWFGVTIRYNNIPQALNDFPKSSFNRMVEIEVDESRDSSSKGAGQLLHFVARKT